MPWTSSVQEYKITPGDICQQMIEVTRPRPLIKVTREQVVAPSHLPECTCNFLWSDDQPQIAKQVLANGMGGMVVTNPVKRQLNFVRLRFEDLVSTELRASI